MDSTGAVVVSNDNWNVPGEEVSAFGLAPSNAREAALVTSLEPGSYTAIVSGKRGHGRRRIVRPLRPRRAEGPGGQHLDPKPRRDGRQCHDRRIYSRR